MNELFLATFPILGFFSIEYLKRETKIAYNITQKHFLNVQHGGGGGDLAQKGNIFITPPLHHPVPSPHRKPVSKTFSVYTYLNP